MKIIKFTDKKIKALINGVIRIGTNFPAFRTHHIKRHNN